MRAVVFTLGCKVNECESDSLIAGLKERGYQVSDKLVVADLYVVNTCAVTAEAEKKSRQTASRIKKLNPNAKIIFTGCACQKNSKAFSEKSADYLITGAFNKGKILDMIDEVGEHIDKETTEFEELCFPTSLRTRAYVKVQDGCNNFCSYCIIPYLRGRSRSRNPQTVIEEIKKLNPSETVINGINLSSYNYQGVNLTGLIERLKDLNTRIRLGSLEVGVITEEFLSALKNLKDFAPHFHLSLQSGSNRVLKTMNRHYTAEEYVQKVDLIRKFFPDAGITTDIIAGFPTETEEDYQDTISLIERVNFSDIHPFPFSPREGTVAGKKYKDLNGEIKRSRVEQLLKIKEIQKSKFARSFEGKILRFLPEEEKDGYTEGYAENYLRLYVKGNVYDKTINKVIVKGCYKDGAIAELIKE